MGAILGALGALGVFVAAGLIVVVGTRISLYIFSLNLEGKRRFAGRMPVAEEQPGNDNGYSVERQRYYDLTNPGDTSAGYAKGGLMVLGLILLLAIMATITMVSGMFH